MNAIKLYIAYVSIAIQSQMEYKTSFIFLSLGNLAITCIEFMGVVALFDRFGTLKTWSLPEIALFYGLINCSFAVAEAFGRGYDVFPNKVLRGEFDRILLRPRGYTLQILGIDFQMMRIGRLLQGLLILTWGLFHLNIHLTLLKISILLYAFLGGIALFTGLFVLQATLSFWSIQSLEIMNSFTYGGVQMAQYPISIYKKWFQKIFIYVIPLACVDYFPILGVIEKNKDYMTHPQLATIAPTLGFVFFFASLFIFRFGARYYPSTGS